ncbi:MAG: ATP-binding cassette domain-containing protein [Bacteroidota bacterium]|nr:ATP-binding cassette domain-containing protein [Bacteroidota bacterium]
MSSAVIELKNLTFRYADGTRALDNIDLSLPYGARVAFLGSNGAGKSTLFSILNGVLKPSGGEYFRNGKLQKFDRKSLFELRKEVGVVFQEPDNQIFSANVYEEVSFGPMNLKLPADEVHRRVQKSLADTGVEEFSHKPAHLLSYGQKKRVTIASVLSMEPSVLVLDEPASGLDPQHSNEIVELLTALNHQGKTILMSTHNVNLAYAWADWLVVMHKGTVLASGNPLELFKDKVLMRNAGLDIPVVLEVYERISRFFPEREVPVSKPELLKMLEELS